MKAARAPSGREKPKLQNWRTPPALIAQLVADYGIAVDVSCTAKDAVLPRFITRTRNGLVAPWSGYGGPAFYNPEYGEQGDWVARAFEHALDGTGSVGLVQVSSSASWTPDFALFGERHFFVPRLRFVDPRVRLRPGEKPKGGADFDVQLVIMRPGLQGAGRWAYRCGNTFKLLFRDVDVPRMARRRLRAIAARSAA